MAQLPVNEAKKLLLLNRYTHTHKYVDLCAVSPLVRSSSTFCTSQVLRVLSVRLLLHKYSIMKECQEAHHFESMKVAHLALTQAHMDLHMNWLEQTNKQHHG